LLTCALTGNIASGKSSVARRLEQLGAVLVDADVLAREAVAPGTPALAAIVDRWGAQLLRDDGSLDRERLRSIVFADEQARLALNAIVHPQVDALRRARVAAARAAGAAIVICDIPLLFEVGRADDFDCVILVDAPAETRLERLMRDRGLTRDDALRMMQAQLPSEAKRARADYIVENDATLEVLQARVDALWDALQRRARETA
jgi:dephospho-CoA kinase